jgi:methionyl-tRNA synthetase
MRLANFAAPPPKPAQYGAPRTPYLQHAAPWTTIESDPARAAIVTRRGLNLVRLSAVLAWSVIPTLSETVLHAFGEEQAVPR